jgi:hypothetical protein
MTMKTMLLPGVIGLATVAGVVISSDISSTIANAASVATGSTGNQSSIQTAATTQPGPMQGGHAGANGVKETLLTGDTATKATAAAQAAVPGATILRVETDAEGATYEAHMKKPDGSLVTVKMDTSFKVTSTENGMGGGPDQTSQSQQQ